MSLRPEEKQENEGATTDSTEPQAEPKKSSPWAQVSNEILSARIQGSVDTLKQKPESNQKEDDVLKQLRLEIAQHEKSDASTSYLGKVFDYMYSKDKQSLESLKSLYKDYNEARIAGDSEKTTKLQKDIQEKIAEDMKNVGFKEELKTLGSTFTKMIFLFVQGNVGVAGTIGSYALDQAKPADPIGTQAFDASLGAAKGFLMRQVVGLAGQAELPIAIKGLTFGVSNRVLELGLTRSNYYDANTGTYSLGTGLQNTFLATLNPQAMMVDSIVFGAATGLTGAANSLSNDMLRRSPFLATVSGAYIFGSTSGALQELHRSQQNGENVDWSKVLWESQKNGILTGLASTVGGLQADRVLRQQIKDKLNPPVTKEMNTEEINRIWNSNPKSMVQKGYFEVFAEKVSAEKHPQGKLVSSSEHPMVLQKDLVIPGQKGPDGKALVLKAGTVLPNGVQLSPREMVSSGMTANEQPIRTLTNVQLITPEAGVRLADGTVIKTATVSDVLVANGQPVKPDTMIITRKSVDLETGKPRIDTYYNSLDAFAKKWREVPGKPGTYSPNLDGNAPMEVVEIPAGTRLKFKVSYDPTGPWVEAKPGDLIKQDFNKDGSLKGYYRVSAQDALETHIPSNSVTAARMDRLTKDFYQLSGAVVDRAKAPPTVLSPFLQSAVDRARAASAQESKPKV